MRTLIRKFYLSFQDGRAEGDKEYNTYEQAQEALEAYGEEKRGMCVMSYEKEMNHVISFY
jgi:hypothetical protein